MPTTEQLRNKLIEKLKELFQLDQPELDFGFYRIMHAKAEQVQRFLENDLLAEVQQAFVDGNAVKQTELKTVYESALAQATEFGAPVPEEAPKVKEAKDRWMNAMDTTKAEAEVYDHLYRFFERYYEDGDFVSRRYLTRETPGKAAPYAVPYDGQEVMLHWANRDQYYIKTSEHFDNYTFELREAAKLLKEEAKKDKEQVTLELGDAELEGDPLRVHFKIVEAAEGEHNNVKESGDKKRYFIVQANDPIAFTEAGELECRFTYRPDPEKTGQEGTWKQLRNSRNEETLLKAIEDLTRTDERASAYLKLVRIPAPKGSKKDDRSLLGKYIEKYTATNSKDYFIHKDLGGFMRRELDFYIKNEVMRLDDIENAEAPKVEHYLAKLRVIRRIAQKLIDFLAQLENFQKRLWLKKKFVVETNYCITLDRVPETLYPAIANNELQKTEWVKLFAIDALDGFKADKPLTVDFLKANPFLVLDTAFQSEMEKSELLNALDDLEAQCNGLLIHSENFQALELIQDRYRENVTSVYIDPPYNTGEDGFPYKDTYKHSSWVTMMYDRLALASKIQSSNAPIYCSINENELWHLLAVMDEVFGKEMYISNFSVKVRHEARILKGDKEVHEVIEYLPAYRRSFAHKVTKRVEDNSSVSDYNWQVRTNGEPSFSLILGNKDVDVFAPSDYQLEKVEANQDALQRINIRGSLREANSSGRFYVAHLEPFMGQHDGHLFRVPNMGKDSLGYRYFLLPAEGSKRRNGDYFQGVPTDRPDTKKVPYPNFLDFEKDFNHSSEEGGISFRNGKKPVAFVKHVLTLSGVNDNPDAVVLDFFAGSGTTGHAVMDLNRKNGSRKYILIEMGNYFDQVTKPRIQKVAYSRAWRDSRPLDREGISQCFKYLRLESYEDSLNALELRTHEEREKELAKNKSLREDYTLRYLLDVETKGSTSLLNHTAFDAPQSYMLNVKRPGSEERVSKPVDMLETFNYLLGLRVQHIAKPELFKADFEHVKDEELGKDQKLRLVVKGHLKPIKMDASDNGAEGWWFRKVQGWMPRDRHKPHGERDKVLIIWRNLSGDIEKDNAVLDEYFTTNRIEVREREFDVIYVNGSNNLPNLWQQGDRWKVRLIEEDFHRLMWEGTE